MIEITKELYSIYFLITLNIWVFFLVFHAQSTCSIVWTNYLVNESGIIYVLFVLSGHLQKTLGAIVTVSFIIITEYKQLKSVDEGSYKSFIEDDMFSIVK